MNSGLKKIFYCKKNFNFFLCGNKIGITINEYCANETCKDKVIKELEKMQDSKQYNQLIIDECVKNIALNKIIATNKGSQINFYDNYCLYLLSYIKNSNEKSEEIKCKIFAKDIQSIKEICKKSKNISRLCLDKIKSVNKAISSAQKELNSIKSISVKLSNIAPSDSPTTPKLCYSSLIPQFDACLLTNSKLFESITSLFDFISKNHSNTSEKLSSLSSLINEYSESRRNITKTVSFDDKDQLDLSSSLQLNS